MQFIYYFQLIDGSYCMWHLHSTYVAHLSLCCLYRPVMKNILLKGTNIIVDRYTYSGIAFSSAKPVCTCSFLYKMKCKFFFFFFQNMNFEWCQQPDTGLLKPDLVIFLDIDPQVAQSRADYGVERYENLEMQKAVRSYYLKLQDETWKVQNNILHYTFIFHRFIFFFCYSGCWW